MVTTSPRPAVGDAATLVPGAAGGHPGAGPPGRRPGAGTRRRAGGPATLAGLGAADVDLAGAEVLASGDEARTVARPRRATSGGP